MNPGNNSIITEDGQRLKVEDGAITGTEEPKDGLAFETGNTVFNEPAPTEAEQQDKERKDE